MSFNTTVHMLGGGGVVEYLDDLVHLCSRDDTVTIQVKHSENFTHHFFWSSIIHDVEDNHELSEVNVATAVGVVYSGKRRRNLQSVSDQKSLEVSEEPEYMFLHLRRIFLRESFLHHLTEIFGHQSPIWMISNEGGERVPDLLLCKSTGL